MKLKLVLLLFVSLGSASLFASEEEMSDFDPDTTVVFHPNQYFIELDSLILEDTINALLTELNSVEVWYNDDINLAVWEVISFPFLTPTGEVIFDIDGVVSTAKKKTKISSSGLNILQTINMRFDTMNTGCFDINEYAGLPGEESIKISILDTGISDISDNSTNAYNYDLVQYSGYDYIRNDSIPDDEHGHGSHLAGIIHSITHQLNPLNTSITFDIRKTHDSLGQAYTSNVVFALLDAIKNKADIINMSFSVNDIYHDTLFYPLEHALLKAEKEGVMVVAAAGNSRIDNDSLNNTTLPATFPLSNIISVASNNCFHEPSLFSSYGSREVDIAIIGEAIPGPDLGSGIVYLSGTSQATAIVTAISALMASNQTEFDHEKIKCSLINSSIHYNGLGDFTVSDGEVDFTASVNYDPINCEMLNEECSVGFTGENILSGIADDNEMYETDQSIQSSQIILSNTQITYDALLNSSLLPGFEIEKGASVQIKSSGCRN